MTQNSDVIQESDINSTNTANGSLYIFTLTAVAALSSTFYRPARAFSVFDDATKFGDNAVSSSKLCFPLTPMFQC